MKYLLLKSKFSPDSVRLVKGSAGAAALIWFNFCSNETHFTPSSNDSLVSVQSPVMSCWR